MEGTAKSSLSNRESRAGKPEKINSEPMRNFLGSFKQICIVLELLDLSPQMSPCLPTGCVFCLSELSPP